MTHTCEPKWMWLEFICFKKHFFNVKLCSAMSILNFFKCYQVQTSLLIWAVYTTYDIKTNVKWVISVWKEKSKYQIDKVTFLVLAYY